MSSKIHKFSIKFTLIKEKLDKAATTLLKDDEQSNILFKTVSAWLTIKESIVHKILLQQCLLNLDQELLAVEDEDDDDDDADDHEPQPQPSAEKFEGLILNDDDIDFETLMKQTQKYVDSTEDINNEPTTPVLNIDYRVSYDDFKIVCLDLNIPCNQVGLHTICKILDPDDASEFDYRKFTTAFILSNLRLVFT